MMPKQGLRLPRRFTPRNDGDEILRFTQNDKEIRNKRRIIL